MNRNVHILLCLISTGLFGGCTGETTDPVIVELAVPAATGSMAPNLASGSDGSVVLSWLEPAGSGHTLRFSRLDDDGWQIAGTVAEGVDWFVNWADFPSVVPATESLWGAHWLVKNAGEPYAYDVATAISRDAGESWHRTARLHDDGTPTEHGFVSLFRTITPDAVGALWLDGRNMITDGGAMSLRSALISSDGTVIQPEIVDERVCDCCQTAVAMGPEGPIAVYRGRSPEEIRDIQVTRSIGGHWETGRPVASDGWVIAGCPVNGPALDTLDSEVVVAWYTAPDNRPRIQLARSSDGAVSFGAAQEVASGAVMGRVGVALLDDGDAVVSWVENVRLDDGSVAAEVRARRMPRGSSGAPAITVAETGAGRPAGFPQLLRRGDTLIFAWTDSRTEPSQVRSARLPVSSLP